MVVGFPPFPLDCDSEINLTTPRQEGGFSTLVSQDQTTGDRLPSPFLDVGIIIVIARSALLQTQFTRGPPLVPATGLLDT